MLEPSYSIDADRTLNRLEADETASELYNAIVTKLHLICTEPASQPAREKLVRTSGGQIFWLVTVRVPSEKDDWGIFWAQDGADAVFTYIGPWPPIR